MPDDRIVYIVNTNDEELGRYTQAELNTSAQRLIAHMLHEADNPDSVSDYLAGLRIVDEIPAQVVIPTALQIIVTQILGGVAKENPAFFLELRRIAREYAAKADPNN